jgi:hypothetical protein
VSAFQGKYTTRSKIVSAGKTPEQLRDFSFLFCHSSCFKYRVFREQADGTLTHTSHKNTEQSIIEASITLDGVTLTDSLIRWSLNEWPSVCREIPVSADKMFWTSNKPAQWTLYIKKSKPKLQDWTITKGLYIQYLNHKTRKKWKLTFYETIKQSFMNTYVGFEVFTAVTTLKIAVFWGVTPCWCGRLNRRFGGSNRLHLQGSTVRERRTSVSR